MGDKVQELGTRFTGDIKDISEKVRQLMALLNQLDTYSRTSSSILGQVTQKAIALNGAIAKTPVAKNFAQNKVMLSEFQLALGGATNESKKFQAALTTLGEGKTGIALKTIKSQLEQVERAIVKTAQKMKMLGQDGEKFFNETDRIKAFNDALAGKTRATATTTRTPVEPKAPSGFLDQIKNAARVTLAYGLVGSAIGSVAMAAKAGVGNIVEFDQALHNLQAITEATNDETSVMGNRIKQIASDTKYTAQQVSDGMTLLGQAGLDAAQATAVIGPAATLATGTLSKMEETVDLLSTTLVAFKMDAAEAGRVTDVMAAAVNKSKLTIEQLRTVFNYVGSSAHMIGMSIEELAASTMVLANTGLRASTIGTGLRQVLAKLLSPSEKLRESFEAHSISLDAVNPKVVGFQQAMKNMIPILWDVKKNTVDMSKAYELFELRGAQAAAVLVESFAGGRFKQAFEDTLEIGSAAEMAAKQSEGLGVMWDNLVAKAGVLAIALGDLGVVGAMKGVISVAGLLTDVMTDMASVTADAFDSLFNSTERQKRLAGEQVVENKAVVGSLKVYIEALKVTQKEVGTNNQVSTAHLSILKRLKADHPELADKIDLTKVSFNSLGTVIASVNRLMDEHNQKTMEGRLKKISLAESARAELDNLKAEAEKTKATIAALKPVSSAKGQGQNEINKSREMDIKYLEAHLKDIEDKIKLSTKSIDETVSEWSAEIANALKGSESPSMDIVDTMIGNMIRLGKVSEETGKKIRENVTAKLKAVAVDLDTSKFTTRIKTMGKDFDAVFKTLDPSKKLDFVEKFGALEKKIANIRKTYANTDIPGEDVEADIAAKKKAFLEEYLKKEADSSQKVVDNASQEAQKRIQIQEYYYATVARLTSDEHEKLEQERLKESESIKKQYEEAIAMANKTGEDKAAIKAKYDNLQDQNTKFYTQKGYDLDQKKSLELLDIEIIKRKQLAEQKKRDTLDDSGGLATIKANEAKVTIESLEQEMRIRKDFRDKTIANYKEGSNDAIAAEKAYQAAVLKVGEAITDEDERQHALRVQQTVKELKMKLKMVQEYSVEYYRIMEELRKLDEIEPISDEERLAGSLDWVDGIRLGLIRSAKEQKTQAQHIADIWQNATNAIGDGFGTLFEDVLVGKVKSAGDYIVSFLSSVAKSVNNVLANAIGQGIATTIGGMFSGGSAGQSPYDSGIAMAQGGWITEPIVGRGINTGKRYTLGERGPELVTPAGQVRPDSFPPSVSVIINNNTGSNMKSQQSNARFDGQQWVVTTLIDAIDRNVNGIRGMLGG